MAELYAANIMVFQDPVLPSVSHTADPSVVPSIHAVQSADPVPSLVGQPLLLGPRNVTFNSTTIRTVKAVKRFLHTLDTANNHERKLYKQCEISDSHGSEYEV
jgi:hypothetical protein